MTRKSKKMIDVERSYQQPLEQLLPPMVTEHGLTATAEALGLSKATLGYWMLKLRMEVRRVVLMPGDTLEIRRPPDDKP